MLTYPIETDNFLKVKSFVEALINMVCELKITAGSKEN